MTDLDDRIAEAQRAAAELERLERLRSELPALQAERARLLREDKAREALEEAQVLSGQVLADFRPAVVSWRQRFDALVKEAEALALELRDFERPVGQVAVDLVRAVNEAQRMGVRCDHAPGLWLRLGWGDDDLEAIPNRDDGRAFRVPGFDEKLGALLADRAGVKVLRPGAGIRQYVQV